MCHRRDEPSMLSESEERKMLVNRRSPSEAKLDNDRWERLFFHF